MSLTSFALKIVRKFTPHFSSSRNFYPQVLSINWCASTDNLGFPLTEGIAKLSRYKSTVVSQQFSSFFYIPVMPFKC